MCVCVRKSKVRSCDVDDGTAFLSLLSPIILSPDFSFPLHTRLRESSEMKTELDRYIRHFLYSKMKTLLFGKRRERERERAMAAGTSIRNGAGRREESINGFDY